jgi:DNA-binding MarR family transcriptional regulator
MTVKLTDAELRAWQALLHAHQDVVRRLDAELRAEHGIAFGDYDILRRLARAQDHTLNMTELAQRVMLPPSTLTRRLDGLVADGLVTRRRSPLDSRLMLATLTDAGRRRVRRAASTHLRGIRQHFTGRLTPTQVDDVATALEAIAGAHEPH